MNRHVTIITALLVLNMYCNQKDFRVRETGAVARQYLPIEFTDNPGGDTLIGKIVTETHDTPTGGKGADTANSTHILAFARQFFGVRYKYASANPLEGFDCSGFLYHVFHQFNIDVPRSSKDYMQYGKEINAADAKPGDFILFTGTDSTVRVCGHVGLITENKNNNILFIHSSSGKANGVTISPLEGYYRTRYLKCTRILKTNDPAL